METAVQPSTWEMFFPFILVFVVSYFLIIRPQSKRAKEHEKLITALKRGDAIITKSGILGVIDGITDLVITLDVGNGVKFKVLKDQVAGPQSALDINTKKN